MFESRQRHALTPCDVFPVIRSAGFFIPASTEFFTLPVRTGWSWCTLRRCSAKVGMRADGKCVRYRIAAHQSFSFISNERGQRVLRFTSLWTQ